MIEGLADGVARQLATPAQRAYWSAYMTGMVFFGLRRVPLVPAFIMSVLAAEAAKKAWAAMGNLERLADAAEQLADPGAAGPLHAA